MTQYVDLHQRVRNFLKASAATYPEQLVMDGVNAGLDAVLPWLPKRSVQRITITSGSLIELPSDVYLVDAVRDPENSVWIEHLSINPTSPKHMSSYWYDYPYGFLTIETNVDITSVDVHYFTAWEKITTSGSPTAALATPPYADLALLYYACSYVLAACALSTSQLRQFNTKIDSGTPEDNPLKDMANLLMQRFMNEVKLFPKIERASQ